MDVEPLDAVDRAIIYHLQEDARQPIIDIADAVNVSDNTVRNRISDLEAEGVITGYQANVDYSAAGIEHHYVFVCTARVSKREGLAEKARELDGVTEVLTLMTGKYNLYVYGAASQNEEITEIAYAIDELGIEIEREHLIREHSRQPFSGFGRDELL